MKRILSVIAGLLFLVSTGVKAQKADSIPPAPYGMSPIEVYSVFSESYKNKDYPTALMYGRWLVVAHPKKIKGFPQYDGSLTFSKMIDMYTQKGENSQDPTLKTAYFDTAGNYYQNVLNTFSDSTIDRYQWIFDEGRFYQQHADFIQNGMDKAVADYEKLFKMDPKQTTQAGNGYYVQAVVNYYVNNGDKDKALSLMKQADPFANDSTEQYFNKVRNQLFTNPKDRIAYLQSRIKDNPKDKDALNELYTLYSQQNDYDNAKKIAKQLFAIEPTYKNANRLASMASENGKYAEAIDYLKDALNKVKTDGEKKQVYLDIADNYINLDKLQTAREYTRDAIHLDPKWGRPYLEMAHIYAQAVQDCSNGPLTRKDKAVYWLVLDYLDRAKEVDPSVTSSANQQINSYKQAAPSVEEKFYQNWKKGEKIKIDKSLKPCYGWIDETTTVR